MHIKRDWEYEDVTKVLDSFGTIGSAQLARLHNRTIGGIRTLSWLWRKFQTEPTYIKRTNMAMYKKFSRYTKSLANGEVKPTINGETSQSLQALALQMEKSMGDLRKNIELFVKKAIEDGVDARVGEMHKELEDLKAFRKAAASQSFASRLLEVATGSRVQRVHI